MNRPTADVSVRVAWADDARGIAEVQVRAWRSAYADLLPPDVLAALEKARTLLGQQLYAEARESAFAAWTEADSALAERSWSINVLRTLFFLPFMLADFAGWAFFLGFSRDREAGYSSIWYAYNTTVQGQGLPQLGPEFINRASLVLFLLACIGIALLVLSAPRRPRLASIVFLIVAALVLTNKVYSPQFVVWLIPLAALAYPRWRDFLIWQFVELLHWWAVWMYLGQFTSGGAPEHNIDGAYYVLAVLAHIAATAYIVYKIVRSILHPEHDPVRRLETDDPQGGPFDRSDDVLVLDSYAVHRWRSRIGSR